MSESGAERIVIIGAGVAGLFAAMMLAGEGRAIVLLDRDAAPPDGDDPDQTFQDWRRGGVGQLRHSHAFLARLVNILRTRHPALLDQLKAAGCREMSLADMLPSTLKDRYVAEPGDALMSILMSRRTTFELVTRHYVAALPGVSLRAGVFVSDLVTEAETPGPIRVLGVRTEAGETIAAEVVIDAAGRLSQAADWLGAAGVPIEETAEPAGILYYTRHFRLIPGREPPPRSAAPGAGDLGYLKYGLFNADNGWFSVTLAVPEIETELRRAMVRPETFDAVCAALPGVAPWTAPERATPQGKVFAMGDLTSRWRRMVNAGRPAALGLFLIGDGLIRSNPLYGRGTSFAAIEAEALVRALSVSRDPTARAVLYDSLVEQALKPFYDHMLDQDRAAIRRAASLRAGAAPSLRGQVMRSFIRDGAGVAVRDDIAAFRAALRAFHMLDPPRDWLRDPRHVGVMLKTWARGRKRNAHLYPGRMGPDRAEMLSLLGIEDRATELAAA